MPASGPWMSTAKLRSLWVAGLTYEEIAEANERATGWKPTRSGVARKLERLDFPPRNVSHADLIPWKIAPEHSKDRIRYMLMAEGRKRAGADLSDSDRTLVSLLHDLLFGRGRFLVVGYSPEVGFYLTDRKDEDEDIIRMPNTTAKASALSTADLPDSLTGRASQTAK
jgi:hypothetical protein